MRSGHDAVLSEQEEMRKQLLKIRSLLTDATAPATAQPPAGCVPRKDSSNNGRSAMNHMRTSSRQELFVLLRSEDPGARGDGPWPVAAVSLPVQDQGRKVQTQSEEPRIRIG